MRSMITLFLLALLCACGRTSRPVAPSAATAPQAPLPAPSPSSNPPAPAAAVAANAGARGGESADIFFNPARFPNAVQGTFLDPKKLTPSQLQFGIAPQHDPRVTWQDNVIVMEKGDQAIREARTDGMTYSFDASAEHVNEFQPGRIIFATGRVVGRVGQLIRNGDTVTVKLTPVQITEVIKEGTFYIDSAFDPRSMIVYSAPDFPSTIDYNDVHKQSYDTRPADGTGIMYALYSDGPAGGSSASFIRTQAALPSGLGQKLGVNVPTLPESTSKIVQTLTGGITAWPVIGSDGGIGLNFNYFKNGLHYNGNGELLLQDPHIRFLLHIGSSGIDTFGIEITGHIGIRLSLVAWSDTNRFVNANLTSALPLDISLPVPIAGIPLSLTFHSSMHLATGFSAKTSILDSKAEWMLDGRLFAGWRNGTPSFEHPAVKPKVSLLDNVSGISVGINSLDGTFNIRPQVGIGAFGFSTGVFLGVGFSGNVAKQSSIALTECRVADATGRIDSGVGYQVPGPVVELINAVLSLFSSARMERTGTLIPGPGGIFMKIDQDIPGGCGGFSACAAPHA